MTSLPYTILLLCIVLSAIPVDGLICRRSSKRAVCYTRSKKISYTGSLSNCVKVCKTKKVRATTTPSSLDCSSYIVFYNWQCKDADENNLYCKEIKAKMDFCLKLMEKRRRKRTSPAPNTTTKAPERPRRPPKDCLPLFPFRFTCRNQSRMSRTSYCEKISGMLERCFGKA
ncbi:unnamed protein product [Cylicocyclus nassatus]|uniref:Uncharacterized protein n=1 Tax=Cylicocyclus nassatus TaxID=53992 RepID=A0AA36M1V2_CYLNA|nr:unnamed protein product [Cylicocyclus nassatus]